MAKVTTFKIGKTAIAPQRGVKDDSTAIGELVLKPRIYGTDNSYFAKEKESSMQYDFDEGTYEDHVYSNMALVGTEARYNINGTNYFVIEDVRGDHPDAGRQTPLINLSGTGSGRVINGYLKKVTISAAQYALLDGVAMTNLNGGQAFRGDVKNDALDARRNWSDVLKIKDNLDTTYDVTYMANLDAARYPGTTAANRKEDLTPEECLAVDARIGI
jgi:hypothetical protein